MENLKTDKHTLSFQIRKKKTSPALNGRAPLLNRRKYTSGYKQAKMKKSAKLMLCYERKEKE